ncbi:7,8-didemethyl-8-hydroxy-5-deazariboflavin synthase subunit CofG [uncultured Methanomethylovorans sp.]|uniref:7,8-didemethyl-8-hydroxy-5-deazariboflavin synthase subunit CofG n=1 Tax=uncultured Methanomethylovorans sp. TaxID=183759 RepID=UPI002AA67A71|nr:7,8-didemethyl-8-hydroxy-5-deazariboflavin synthase subunit CofG [uncultured Methanomethylovorans sp.]
MKDFVTFSRNVFVPVTNVCRNRCGYCTFRREPDEPGSCFMSPDEVIPILKDGKKAGCTEVLFTFGEYADEIPEYKKWLEELGFPSNVEYVIHLCKLAIKVGILPHTNAGVLNYTELEALKPWNASMGLMLETTGKVAAHLNCPGKHPDVRIKTIKYAGELQIPFTTGILVGIGETLDDRIDSLQCISNLHQEYGHIQEVIVQNFIPKTGTFMEKHSSPTIEDMMQIVSIAREILPADIAIQVAPNLIDPYLLVKYGATDLGGISPTTIDWINPETEWPSVEKLQEMLRDISLRERLPIYPAYIKKGWYSKNLKSLIKSMIDNDGYRRL